jgi:2'-5' RNA ligase
MGGGPSQGGTTPRPLRLFVAVDLPDDAREAVARAVEPLRRVIPGARWGDRSGWHVTLKFLGSTPPEEVAAVADLVEGVAAGASPFETGLEGLGTFPAHGPARVLWVGLDDRSGRLAGLALAVDAALAPRFELERRPPHPHVTVARLDPPRRVLDALGEAVVAPIRFGVDHIGLYHSHLGGGRPRYELLATARLGTG